MIINNEVDLALIVALIALITPLLTSLINVLYQLWIRYLDNKEKCRKSKIKQIEEVFIGYLSSLGKIVSTGTIENMTDYGKYFPLVLLYLPEDKRQILIEVDSDILVSRCVSNASNKYNQIVEIIQTELDKLYKS